MSISLKNKFYLVVFLFLPQAEPGHGRDTDFKQFVWKKQIPLALVSGGLWAGSWLLKNQLVEPHCPCGKGPKNALDRKFAGVRNDRIARISDVCLGLAMGLPLAVQIGRALHLRQRPNHVIADTMGVVEIVLINGALNEMIKLATRRPRPLVYGLEPSSPEIQDSENYLSFYSSHTSRIFALGMGAARIYSLRHPKSRSGKIIYFGAAILGIGMGSLRVLAGRHYPTDALVGAFVGTMSGLVLPQLLANNILTLAPTKERGLSTFAARLGLSPLAAQFFPLGLSSPQAPLGLQLALKF